MAIDQFPVDVSTESVRQHLIAGREVAIVDLRSEYAFAQGHPLFAISLPLGRIELRVLDLLPNFDIPLVLYDNGEGYIIRAAQTLSRLGYRRLFQLVGGLTGWVEAGGELFRDVNVPSKAFGELLAEHRHTPMRSAREVQAAIARGDDLVILDGRRAEEYRTMAIPGGRSLPNGELIKRATSSAPDPTTTIIVNCAGRTRSIIGAQSLVHAGIPNPVFALENGTIGWELAGLSLELGATREAAAADPGELLKAQATAARLAERASLPLFGPESLRQWRNDQNRTVYLLDVRSPEEFRAGHLPGFRSAPGGQLVQATDEWVGVRHARIVLADDDGVRARATGFWLRQLGWREIAVLDPNLLRHGDLERGEVAPRVPSPSPAPITAITPAQLNEARDNFVVLDVTTSPQYRRFHIPGAYFAQPADLPLQLGPLAGRELVITCLTGTLSPFVAADLAQQGLRVRWLRGGTKEWQQIGLPVESGYDRPYLLSSTDDVYKRPYEGTDNQSAAKQAYLDWEFGLVVQLARDGTHGFEVF